LGRPTIPQFNGMFSVSLVLLIEVTRLGVLFSRREFVSYRIVH
jgi:hypothetical protein